MAAKDAVPVSIGFPMLRSAIAPRATNRWLAETGGPSPLHAGYEARREAASQRKRCNSQAAKVICVGRAGKPCAGADRPAPKPAPFPDSPAGFLELWRGHRGSDKSKVLQQRPVPRTPDRWHS